jgi:glycosyltransferase involved in cell wall biosynthesis
MSGIHIVNPFRNPFGGSEQRALMLYEQLRGHTEVRLWSLAAADPHYAERYPISPLDGAGPSLPGGGTFVIVGAYFEAETIFPQLRPQRLIYVYNTPSPNLFRERLDLVRHYAGVEPEIVYASEEGAREIGLPGRVEASPIDLERFHPRRRSEVARRGARFVLGRMSRDVLQKHHPGDLAVYREALRRGWSLRLMGATCLQESWAAAEETEPVLLPCGTEAPEHFLATLDCFYYRVSETWTEAFGRVVPEAMASGLPVVCDRRVGAARIIEDGVDGFVTTGAGESLAVLQRLRDDTELRTGIGEAARRKVEEIYSATYEKELIAFYTR